MSEKVVPKKKRTMIFVNIIDSMTENKSIW